MGGGTNQPAPVTLSHGDPALPGAGLGWLSAAPGGSRHRGRRTGRAWGGCTVPAVAWLQAPSHWRGEGGLEQRWWRKPDSSEQASRQEIPSCPAVPFLLWLQPLDRQTTALALRLGWAQGALPSTGTPWHTTPSSLSMRKTYTVVLLCIAIRSEACRPSLQGGLITLCASPSTQPSWEWVRADARRARLVLWCRHTTSTPFTTAN